MQFGFKVPISGFKLSIQGAVLCKIYALGIFTEVLS